MSLSIPEKILTEIQQHGEDAYPDEGAGLMLGYEEQETRYVSALLKLENAREESSRHNRYLLTAEDMLQGEKEADRLGLSIVGIFHSHPDHPSQPSEYDREWAIPWYSYLITSVHQSEAVDSRSWRLADDRSTFFSEPIHIQSNQSEV